MQICVGICVWGRLEPALTQDTCQLQTTHVILQANCVYATLQGVPSMPIALHKQVVMFMQGSYQSLQRTLL